MNDIGQHLRTILGTPGRVAVVGIGNIESGDDGFGVCLVNGIMNRLGVLCDDGEAARFDGQANCEFIVAGVEPERHSRRLVESGFDRVLFVDAVACEGDPGTIVLMDCKELEELRLEVSTHRIGLGLLAKYIEEVCGARVWLLGVKPESVKRGTGLSAPVKESLNVLESLMGEMLEVARC
ncbi:MAG: hydrogenase maturation protease [Verrucomicrobiota bacterium]|nr:hydrogenase maturation protease [Verrucomicrobiota bacterium]